MIETVISLLIYVCVLALVVYIIFWVLAQIGIVIPAQIQKIIWVIVVLLVILAVVEILLPGGGGMLFFRR